MANCTYTVRRLGCVAWTEGHTYLADAADARLQANRIAPGHGIYAEWPSGEVTDVDEDDVQAALAERAVVEESTQ